MNWIIFFRFFWFVCVLDTNQLIELIVCHWRRHWFCFIASGDKNNLHLIPFNATTARWVLICVWLSDGGLYSGFCPDFRWCAVIWSLQCWWTDFSFLWCRHSRRTQVNDWNGAYLLTIFGLSHSYDTLTLSLHCWKYWFEVHNPYFVKILW